MHRPLKGESRSIAKMRAQYQVGPTRNQYVYGPSMPTEDPGVERPNTLGILNYHTGFISGFRSSGDKCLCSGKLQWWASTYPGGTSIINQHSQDYI